MDKQQILRELRVFSLRTGGIGSWLTEDTNAEALGRLGQIQDEPLTKVYLNQPLAFGHEAPVSDNFFRKGGQPALLRDVPPVAVPGSGASFVNGPETEDDLEALRRSVARGSPCAEADWQKPIAVRLKLESSLRDSWRPKKARKVSLTPFAPS